MQAFFSVFPAQAGMILVFAVIASPVSGIPRASGDDPVVAAIFLLFFRYSPRKRG